MDSKECMFSENDLNKMDSLRSIVKGEQIVPLTVLNRCERFCQERFSDFYDSPPPSSDNNYELSIQQKPIKVMTS